MTTNLYKSETCSFAGNFSRSGDLLGGLWGPFGRPFGLPEAFMSVQKRFSRAPK